MKLSKAQRDMLDRVCRTNGGGVNGFSLTRRTMEGLEAKGLIQGKSSDQCMVVHTREGLELWRRLQTEANQ